MACVPRSERGGCSRGVRRIVVQRGSVLRKGQSPKTGTPRPDRLKNRCTLGPSRQRILCLFQARKETQRNVFALSNVMLVLFYLLYVIVTRLTRTIRRQELSVDIRMPSSPTVYPLHPTPVVALNLSRTYDDTDTRTTYVHQSVLQYVV